MGTVHVVGAGLAGLSAAVALAGRGERVVLHEAARQAGGRCRSYFDPALGLTIDNGNHLLLSGNPRRLQSRAADSFYRELEDALVSLAVSARTGDRGVALATLRNLRDVSQKYTDEWSLANDVANEMATFSPTGLRHAEDVERIQHLLVGSDRAMRNLRVIARRQAEFLEAVRGDAHSTLADALLAARDAVQELRVAVTHEEVDFTTARRQLRLFGSYLTPEMLLRNDEGLRPGRAGHFEGVTLTIQLRSLAIDLLQATGLTSAEAKKFLPSLVIAADGDAIGPRPMTMEMKAVEPPATTEALEAAQCGSEKERLSRCEPTCSTHSGRIAATLRAHSREVSTSSTATTSSGGCLARTDPGLMAKLEPRVPRYSRGPGRAPLRRAEVRVSDVLSRPMCDSRPESRAVMMSSTSAGSSLRLSLRSLAIRLSWLCRSCHSRILR